MTKKKQSANKLRRALAFVCAVVMLLPLLTIPAGAELDSGDVTAECLNGQVTIFKWTAIHDTKEIPAGTHYIMPLTEMNTVWHNSTGSERSDKWGWQWDTDPDRSFIGNRKYSTQGHEGDVFYTVGSHNAPVICYTPMKGDDVYFGKNLENKYWDSLNNGPMCTFWTTEDKVVDGKTVTTLTALRLSDSWWGTLEDSAYWGNRYHGYADDAKKAAETAATEEARKDFLANEKYWRDIAEGFQVRIENFAQKVALQRSGGESPLAKYDGAGPYHYAIGKVHYVDNGWFDITREETGKNNTLRIETNPKNTEYYQKIWGEFEAPWETRCKFNLWLGEPTAYSTLTKDFTVQSGMTLNLNAAEGFDGVYIPAGITLTVNPGGTLAINETVYNDGTIINNGGTVIIQSEGRLSNLAVDGKNEIIMKNGDFIIMPGGALYTNADCAMTLGNSRLINFGTIAMGGNMFLYSSFLENRESGVIVGNMRFGREIERVRFKKWDDYSQEVYADFDYNTREYLGGSIAEWEVAVYYTLDALDSGLFNKELLLGTESWPEEIKDWTPYFADLDLKVLRGEKKGNIPMVNFNKDTPSKIYIYDTEKHYSQYGCIYNEGKVINLDVGTDSSPGNDIVLYKKSAGDVKTLIDALRSE